MTALKVFYDHFQASYPFIWIPIYVRRSSFTALLSQLSKSTNFPIINILQEKQHFLLLIILVFNFKTTGYF